MNQSINTDSKNNKEPQQKYRLGTVSIKILRGLNRFYRLNLNPSLMNYLLSRQTLNQIIKFSDIKRPRQLQKFCLADYVSKVNVIYPKGNKLPENVDDKNNDRISDGSSSDENEDSEDGETSENENSVPGLIHIAKNGTKYKY